MDWHSVPCGAVVAPGPACLPHTACTSPTPGLALLAAYGLNSTLHTIQGDWSRACAACGTHTEPDFCTGSSASLDHAPSCPLALKPPWRTSPAGYLMQSAIWTPYTACSTGSNLCTAWTGMCYMHRSRSAWEPICKTGPVQGLHVAHPPDWFPVQHGVHRVGLDHIAQWTGSGPQVTCLTLFFLTVLILLDNIFNLCYPCCSLSSCKKDVTQSSFEEDCEN